MNDSSVPDACTLNDAEFREREQKILQKLRQMRLERKELAGGYGFRALELMATLPGIKFYEANGYKGNRRVEYEIAEGVKIEFLPMRKECG
ncbi:MAG TPA: hypothetical protein VF604_21425 [Pyrinomonadaceae bacterium]|jgi:hypothetical protein